MSFNVGYTSPGSQSGVFAGLTGSKVTLTQSGILQSISFFCSGNSGPTMLLGLYSNSAGLPNALLATSAATASVSGLNTLNTTTNPTLASGDYWLIQQAINNINGYYDTPLGAGAFNGSVSWTGSLPSTWPGGGGSGAYAFSLYATFNPVVSALSFPMTIVDTSAVTALGFRVNRRFSFAAADTSAVTALGFRVNRRFPFAVADTSTVTALGLSVGRHFSLGISDTSVVTALGLRIERRFQFAASDISNVLALGNPRPSIRFPLGIADVSLVTALGFTRSAAGMIFAGAKVSPGGVPGVGVLAGTWTNLSLGTGWTAPIQGQYQIQTSGTTTMVYFRGMIQAAYSALGTTAFTVPAGAQPSMTRSCVLGGAQNTGTPSDVASYLATVSSAGVCTVYFLCGAALTWADPSKTQQVYLDSLSYSL